MHGSSRCCLQSIVKLKYLAIATLHLLHIFEVAFVIQGVSSLHNEHINLTLVTTNHAFDMYSYDGDHEAYLSSQYSWQNMQHSYVEVLSLILLTS